MQIAAFSGKIESEKEVHGEKSKQTIFLVDSYNCLKDGGR
jgi:hypothetical protein